MISCDAPRLDGRWLHMLESFMNTCESLGILSTYYSICKCDITTLILVKIAWHLIPKYI